MYQTSKLALLKLLRRKESFIDCFYDFENGEQLMRAVYPKYSDCNLEDLKILRLYYPHRGHIFALACVFQ